MIVAAARRFLVLLFSVGAGSLATGALIGLASGSSARRGGAISLYAVGALCAVIGAGLGLRNSLPKAGSDAPGANADRETSGPDRELAGLLTVLGLLLLVVAIVIDTRARLV